ncbi:MAG: DUF1446 domain-containing protein [Chloroflexi bacterium]|nr:MAG: DUF1446 domain-containing protein [Chloroflexota bacterium]
MTRGQAAKRSAVLCASGSLGLTPFHPDSFWAGIKMRPDVVAADAGSGDIGPFYLGSGHWYNLREWEDQDLTTMLMGARACGARMIVGSAGGAGLDKAVDLYFDLVSATIRRERLGPLKIARIYSQVTKDWLRDRVAYSAPLGAPWPLTDQVIDETANAVAMIGVEPYLRALDDGADVIIAGRSCDDVLFAAHPVWLGLERGLSLHMGKCIECGPLVATPPLQRESVIGIVDVDGFTVEPLHPAMRCTPASVTGHTLYERLDPFHQAGPGGMVDMTHVAYEAMSDRVVRVTGSRWVEAAEYRVKVEGSGWVGARKVVIFGFRDPVAIAHINEILEDIRREVVRVVGADGWQLHFSVYGRDAIMGARDLMNANSGHEIAVLAQAIAPDEGTATRIAKLVKYGSLRAQYGGKFGKGGGAALPGDEVLSPDQEAYRWTIDHLVTIANPFDCCRVEVESVS